MADSDNEDLPIGSMVKTMVAGSPNGYEVVHKITGPVGGVFRTYQDANHLAQQYGRDNVIIRKIGQTGTVPKG